MNGGQKRVGILTGGGDCAGLNAVVASIVKAGTYHGGYELIGFLKGWNGILENKYRTLGLDDVRGISSFGGTILGTTNHGRFNAKGTGDGQTIPREILEEAKRNLDELGVEGLIVIGGDGTLSGALQLGALGVNIIGVPKTIDNDLSGTDQTFGFSTAVDIAVESLDRIHTTATSHERVFLVECMGRNAGWITLHAGLASGANVILLPEFRVDMPSLVDFLRLRMNTHGSVVIAMAEGIAAHYDKKVVTETYVDREVKLVGASSLLMHDIEQYAPGEFEMRNAVLGHTLRGGSPNAVDRILSKRYGLEAFAAYTRGEYGSMVRVRDGEIGTVPIAEAVGQQKLVTHDDPLYNTAKQLGIYVNW